MTMKKLILLTLLLWPSVVWGFSMETAVRWEETRRQYRHEYRMSEYYPPPEIDPVRAANYPSLSPIYDDKNKGDDPYITSGCGYRGWVCAGASTHHLALDISKRNKENVPVVATGGGRVVFAGWRGGYGYTVIVEHWPGVWSQYGHLEAILVSVGETVSRRDVIGIMGSTGISTAPHVDYQIKVLEDGRVRKVDPRDWMLPDERPPFKWEI
jgi:murein DD-endopeptidase MepM/ murein hydrolase activator NlpD